MNITTIVDVDNLEVESNIKAKATSIARTHIEQKYGIDVEAIGYLYVSTNVEATI
jgi:hypothetical protein